MSESIGIVVPAYEPDVGTLASYLEALRARLDPDALRIELDDPDPETLRLIEARAIDGYPGTTLAVANVRRGKGVAVAAGLDTLECDRIGFVDADGSTPADSAADVFAALDDAAVAVGSRRHPDAEVRDHQTVVRRLLGDGFARLARRLHPVDLHDYQCGAKAIARPAWRRIRGELTATGFAWDLQFVAAAAAAGYRIAEVPVQWDDHPESTVDPIPTAAAFLATLVEIRFGRSPAGREESSDVRAGEPGPGIDDG